MSTSLVPHKSHAPALFGVSAVLKIAQEATADVPIVRQIIGTAARIVELAEVRVAR